MVNRKTFKLEFKLFITFVKNCPPLRNPMRKKFLTYGILICKIKIMLSLKNELSIEIPLKKFIFNI